MRGLSEAVLAAALCALAGCAAAAPPPAPPPPPPAPVPVVEVKPDEWNLFPDPLTGRVDVYHEGSYVGAVTGNEAEDPPEPHRVPGDEQNQIDQDE